MSDSRWSDVEADVGQALMQAAPQAGRPSSETIATVLVRVSRAGDRKMGDLLGNISETHNRSRLWSVWRDGARVATLRVGSEYRDPLPSIVELKGAANAEVPRELWWAARQWLHMHDLSQIDMERRDWGTAPLDRTTWLSLWRPYWLAKRRIPQWLPIAPSRGALGAL